MNKKITYSYNRNTIEIATKQSENKNWVSEPYIYWENGDSEEDMFPYEEYSKYVNEQFPYGFSTKEASVEHCYSYCVNLIDKGRCGP